MVTVCYLGNFAYICPIKPKEYVDRATLAKVGDEISGISGVNLVFVIGEISEKEVYISSRSDGSISCQLLCEKLGGGGHYTASAVTLQNCSIEEAKNRLAEVLNLYLYDSRSRKGE